MINILVHPPGDGSQNTITIQGRKYTAAPGTPIAMPDADAQIAGASGWTIASKGATGTTAQRPANPSKGTQFEDTTVGYSILWDGKTWRNHVTGAAV